MLDGYCNEDVVLICIHGRRGSRVNVPWCFHWQQHEYWYAFFTAFVEPESCGMASLQNVSRMHVVALLHHGEYSFNLLLFKDCVPLFTSNVLSLRSNDSTYMQWMHLKKYNYALTCGTSPDHHLKQSWPSIRLWTIHLKIITLEMFMM